MNFGSMWKNGEKKYTTNYGNSKIPNNNGTGRLQSPNKKKSQESQRLFPERCNNRGVN